MRIKVIKKANDGMGTIVVDENGDMLENSITDIQWKVSACGYPETIMTFINMEVEVERDTHNDEK